MLFLENFGIFGQFLKGIVHSIFCKSAFFPLCFRLTVVVELALDLWVVLELQVVLADRNRTHLPRVAGAALCRGLRVRLYHLQIRAIYLIIYS